MHSSFSRPAEMPPPASLPFAGPPVLIRTQPNHPNQFRAHCLPSPFHPLHRALPSSVPAISLAPPVSSVDWRRVLRLAAIAAAATAASQVVAAPLIAAHDIAKLSAAPLSLPSALARAAAAGTLFTGLPLHLAKRAPTKALSAALAEFSHLPHEHRTPSRTAAFVTAGVATTVAMSVTYPIHAIYYAARKGIKPFACRSALGARLYSGVIPAVVSVFVVAIADKALYTNLRTSLRRAPAILSQALRPPPARAYMATASTAAVAAPAPRPVDRLWEGVALVVAAGASAAMAGALAEPLKAIARKTAVSALRGSRAVSARTTAERIWRSGSGGIGVFWEGYRARALRYAVAAPVAKYTSSVLKNE